MVDFKVEREYPVTAVNVWSVLSKLEERLKYLDNKFEDAGVDESKDKNEP